MKTGIASKVAETEAINNIPRKINRHYAAYTLSDEEKEVLEKYRPKIKKSDPPIFTTKYQTKMVSELADLHTYNSLASQKALNKLRKWGRAISDDFAYRFYHKKYFKFDKKTIADLKETFFATFGQIVQVK